MAIPLEHDLHDGVLMGKEGLVAISKVETPDLDVLVGGTGGDQLAVGRDVHVEDGKLVAVEVVEEFEGIGEEDFDCVVEEGGGNVLSIWCKSDAENVVGEFDGAGMDEAEDGAGALGAGNLFLDYLELPKFDGFVGTTGDNTLSIGVDLEGPDGPIMGLDLLGHGRGSNVKHLELSSLRTDNDLDKTLGSELCERRCDQLTILSPGKNEQQRAYPHSKVLIQACVRTFQIFKLPFDAEANILSSELRERARTSDL